MSVWMSTRCLMELVAKAYNKIDTADLLEELCCDSEQCAAEVLRRPVGQQLAHLEFAKRALGGEGLVDVGELQADSFRVDVLICKAGEKFLCFFLAAAHDQPAGAVR